VEAGILDVAYDLVDTPIGQLFVAATDRGLCRISFDPETERVVEYLSRTLGTRVLRAPRPVDKTRRQLEEYFDKRRTDFALDIDLRLAAGFSRRVLDELALVPYGEVTTYGELAKRAERPRAARAVGTVMNRNPIPIVLPCHRVVGSTGSLVGYGGGLDRKEALLRLEGAIL
jgi:methylated-DNA-[protein]-cysteine S-methyltransferase